MDGHETGCGAGRDPSGPQARIAPLGWGVDAVTGPDEGGEP